jgi:hypothetical protein
MIGIDMVVDLILLDTCLNPSLVYNTAVHVVTFGIGYFLPDLRIVTILMYDIVCLRVCRDSPTTIYDDLSAYHLYLFGSRLISSIMERIFNYSKSGISK